jgi:hypothetical protein
MPEANCTCPASVPPFAAVLDQSCPVHGAIAATLVVEAIDAGRLIAQQPPGQCEMCGAVEETRPYGPNGESVCFGCGMKDEEAMKRAFDRRMGG